jgi:hypothetical protein
MLRIRKPYFAGKLYPSDKLNLEREIAIFLESSVQNFQVDQPAGVILPHGGYRNTGGIIAKALTYFIDRKIDSVILLAPYHKYAEKYFEIYDGTAYETPLGSVAVDKELVKKCKELGVSDEYFGDELHESEDYAIEINLPFFQEVFGNFRLFPVFFSNQIPYSEIVKFVDVLLQLPFTERHLIISTVNLSKDFPYDKATAHDTRILEMLEKKQLVSLQKSFEKGDIRICGIRPLSAQILYLHKLGKKNLSILSYRNSGDIDGKKEKTSGYFSGIIY